ncbi:MAG: 3-deoxy-7-phosphoheptulonate synthase [Ruminococcus sp.]|uniref:3-deoxy-7-phosphoheptulonate synthase n=1 Tax=Ruminococcus sp. TaxID=41978 RepID=UPI0025F527CF|nr:3-deoxy-7-phosphoheptulonate synthase [Ruminococcus sp.]MCR5601030.1 3-deoxy-7-phosphoheptulonate synthase [Ruminococcus sp.]
MNMNFKCKLPIPKEVKEQYPVSEELQKIISARNKEIADVISGSSDKLLLIIGPCSADREDSVLDYIHRLREVQEKVSDKILIVPRIYTNKPRSTGKGYKGMLHQPDPDKAPDMFKGIVAIRELHLRAIQETGFTCADEMLYPENHRYINDLLGYVAVGARSVENQQHRLTASGLNVPVGLKNPVSGSMPVLMNSIEAAQSGHTFLYRGWEVSTSGNPLAHAILRGYENNHGQSMPNYHYEDIQLLFDMYEQKGFSNPAVIIDSNHCNSGKRPLEQPRIIKEVLSGCRYNEHIRRIVKGFMVESYIEDGSQKVDEHIYGKSITDPCIGWIKTEKMIYEIADML